jgi:hypothetical protein
MYHTVLCAAHTVDITSKLRAFEATFKAACFKGGVAPNKALLQVLQQHQEDAVPLKRVREGEWGQLRTEGGGGTQSGASAEQCTRKTAGRPGSRCQQCTLGVRQRGPAPGRCSAE